MKPIINRLTGYTTLFFFPLLLVRKNHILVFLLLALITAGCFQKFYSTGRTTQVSASQIEELQRQNKVFILHYGDGSNVLRAQEIKPINDSLTGMASPLDDTHSKALKPVKENANVISGKALPDVINEVHIYSRIAPTATTGTFSIPLSGIYRLDVYSFDEKSTKRSTTMSIIGIVAAVAVIAVSVVVIAGSASMASTVATSASSCGCPEIFLEEQGQYQYVNGVFSGAMYANMERSDYLPLGDIAARSNIKLQIRSNPKEQQYLDQVELVAVQHAPGEKILADRKGVFHKYANEINAASAVDENGADVKNTIRDSDDDIFRFNADLEDANLSSLELEFNVPEGSGPTLLIIRGRNSAWAAAMNQSFTQLFGKEYPQWRAKKEKDSRDEMEKWQLEQGLPIKVAALTAKGWKYLDYFPLAGTMAPRDMAMAIDRSIVSGGKLKLRLETVFNFWEIDKISLALNTTSAEGRIIPLSEPLEMLKKADGSYYTMDDKDKSSLSISFSDPAWQNGVSYFLHARGYYHNEDIYPGEADRETLKKFRDMQAFSQFSKSQYSMYKAFTTVPK